MKLYLVHVGFYDEPLGIYESHTNYFIAAESPQVAKEKMKAKPIFKEKKMHIDGMQEITQVDGFNVILTATDNFNSENPIFKYDSVKTL